MEEKNEWDDNEEGLDRHYNMAIPDLPIHLNPRHCYAWNGKKWTKLNHAAIATENKKMGAVNFFDMSHGTVCDTGLNYQIVQQFIATTPGDILAEKLELAIGRPSSFIDIIAKIKSHLGDEARAVSCLEGRENHREMVVTGANGGSPVLILFRAEEHKEVYDLTMDILARPDVAVSIKKKIASEFEDEKMGMIKWWFIGKHGQDSRDIYLPQLKTEIHPEYYPDLGDPKKYIDDYMASDEAILMMAGAPGTGKTTLLRHLISDHKLTAHVIYDEQLMQKDSIFQDFLFDDDSDLMIIEDADTILSDRERDGNKMMSRFLNVSDGLIKLPNKKLVFTTNIADFGRVDHALLRPGRCFGVLHTRALNLVEAQAAAKVASLPVPMEKREYTIAELFNQGKKSQVRTVGFGARH